MTDADFKLIESELDDSLQNLTDSNTVLLPLNYLADATGLSFDMVEAQVDRILARRGLKLNKMRDKDRSGKITRLNLWKP